MRVLVGRYSSLGTAICCIYVSAADDLGVNLRFAQRTERTEERKLCRL